MATLPATVQASHAFPPRVQTSCEFSQVLMKLQRATYLVASTLDLDCLLDRVVNDLAASIGNVEVDVWLRDGRSNELVLSGVRGCTKNKLGARLKIGLEGMVGHVAATGKMRYARDVAKDPYYIPCEPETRSSVSIPLKADGQVIGALCIEHCEIDAFSEDQLQILEALAGHIAISVENARLFKNERVERARLEREHADARAMQRALFLKPQPLVPASLLKPHGIQPELSPATGSTLSISATSGTGSHSQMSPAKGCQPRCSCPQRAPCFAPSRRSTRRPHRHSST